MRVDQTTLERMIISKNHYLAPYVPSNPLVVEEMLKLAKIVPNKETVYDLGCGDGTIVIRAVQPPYCAKRSVGIEWDKELAEKAMEIVRGLCLEEKVEIIHDDVFNVDLSGADVVTLYLTEKGNEIIRPKLEKELKKTARVVSQVYPLKGWKPSEAWSLRFFNAEKCYKRSIYLYKMREVRKFLR